MGLISQWIFITIAILIVFIIWILIIRYFFRPLFFKPKLYSSETLDFLKKEKLEFIDKRELNKVERKLNHFDYKGLSLKNMFSERVEYILVAYSNPEQEYRFFWVELTKFYLSHLKFLLEFFTYHKMGKNRDLRFKEIKNEQVLLGLKKKYEVETVFVIDVCPGCHNKISENISECPNCGLNFII